MKKNIFFTKKFFGPGSEKYCKKHNTFRNAKIKQK